MTIWQEALGVAGSVLPYSLKFWEWSEEAPSWTAEEMKDMRGKKAIVTGGTGGVGLETCFELIRAGAHVFMGARSESKFHAAQTTIQQRLSRIEPPSDDEVHFWGRLEYLPCDVSTIGQADRAAKYFLARDDVDRLDVFVACAGRGAGKGRLNADGVEPFMATNCVNHIVMILRLLPLLRKSGQGQRTSSRVVFVSSVAHFWCSLPKQVCLPVTFASWDDVNDGRRTEAMLYAQSKLAQILMVKRLTLELNRSTTDGNGEGSANVAFLAIHPGEINNHFVHQHFVGRSKDLGILSILGQVRPLLQLFLLNAREGARTCLFAATSNDVDEHRWRGEYLTYPCRRSMPSRLAMSEDLGHRCWTLVNQVIERSLNDVVAKA